MIVHDVAIVGGGPAGAAAAILLARAGARVSLIDRGGKGPRLEGLSPRVLQVMAGQRLEAAGVGPAVERAVRWGAHDQAPNREHPVERSAFDAGLRAQAAGEGVRVLRARAGRSTPGQVELSDGAVQARLVVEARGRAAPAGRARLRGPATVAICGWAKGGVEGAGESRDGRTGDGRTGIEARPDGWVWRAAMVGAGPGLADRPAYGSGCSEAPAYGQMVRDARGVARGIDGLAAAWRAMLGSEPPERLTARAAELRLNAPELDPDLPRIGDAAVAMDPLSGHGVFWALSHAMSAVPMLRAILDGEAELARAFYRARVAAQFWRQARTGRDFHRLAGFDTPFWQARAGWPDDVPAHGEPLGVALRRQVVVRDGRLVEADALVTPRDPDGVAFVAGREIAPVLRRLGQAPLPARAEFCARVLPEASPAEAGLIHDWLSDRGVLSLPPTTGDEWREVRA